MKLHHPAVQFDVQSIGTHCKFYDVGIFTLIGQLPSPITFRHVTSVALTPSGPIELCKIMDGPIANALM
jgi:hypothetical protein